MKWTTWSWETNVINLKFLSIMFHRSAVSISYLNFYIHLSMSFTCPPLSIYLSKYLYIVCTHTYTHTSEFCPLYPLWFSFLFIWSPSFFLFLCNSLIIFKNNVFLFPFKRFSPFDVLLYELLIINDGHSKLYEKLFWSCFLFCHQSNLLYIVSKCVCVYVCEIIYCS